jgi:hypothetical protein
LLFQVSLVVALWIGMATRVPHFLLKTYLPGYLAGLCLCALQGYFEHARGVTSHYGALYNMLFFNDGYHAEHHNNPAMHWTRLPRHVVAEAHTSGWPAVLRWIDWLSLEGLERLVLRWPALQRFVLNAHEQALQTLVQRLPRGGRVGIVGGGLFPRTALILERLLPGAHMTIIDANRRNLDTARRLISPAGRFHFLHAQYPQDVREDFDLLVFPLCFIGDREAIYRMPPAAAVIVHDWIWRRRGSSRIVSIWLCKRINLVVRR